VVVAGAHLIHAGMVAKLAAGKKERNAAILKVIKKESGIRCLSEQYKVSVELRFCFLLLLLLESIITFCPC
jgi:hypothetical protein